jgi:hypothetical protein
MRGEDRKRRRRNVTDYPGSLIQVLILLIESVKQWM